MVYLIISKRRVIELCKYCEDGAFNTLIESEYMEYVSNVFGKVYIRDNPEEIDNSVVFEIRCGSGYIRLGDRGEMNCIDHEEKIQITYCPFCGRKIKGE